MSFGFIITRCVNSEKTNKYWNQSVKLLRHLYPRKQIIIIDDNSNPEFIKADFEYQNVNIIQSEYPGSGELLPYVYFLKNPSWFDNAVILHDSAFVHKKIAFDKVKEPILPFWHFSYDKENVHNILRICSGLKNNYRLMQLLSQNNHALGVNMNIYNTDNFVCCFGMQAYIKHSFLSSLEEKYGISNLVHFVKTRTDRCAMERIIGLLFCLEHQPLVHYKSLLGNIQVTGNWGYTYDQYEEQFKNKKVNKMIVKVWTGR